MKPLTHDDLLTLEAYARQRNDWRNKVMAHKKARTVRLGDHLSVIFEDRLTIQYQVQEMLRVERIFEPAAIQDELDAYNPLIPDGSNLKATLMVEYPDPEQRRRELARLLGLEHHIRLQVDGHEAVTAFADEDMERSTPDKTSAVHFLRFELTADMISAWKGGAGVVLRSDLPACTVETALDATQRDALAGDFD